MRVVIPSKNYNRRCHTKPMDKGFDIIALLRIYRKIEGTRIDMSVNPSPTNQNSGNKILFNLTKLGHMLFKVEP